MGVTFWQFFPPKPTLTEENLPSQQGKVFIVTGGASGVGFELCSILYQAGAKVYLAGRSKENADSAISNINSLPCKTPGELIFLHVALDDLRTIKPAVEEFMKRETRLDVLFNNAGVFNPPIGSVSSHGHELQMATNCLGPYLLTQLLLPILINTSKNSISASVRVVWTSTLLVDTSAPTGGGITKDSLSKLLDTDPATNYTTSKTGNWYLAHSLSEQVSKHGILSITQNPGNLATQSTRHLHWSMPYLLAPLTYPARFGAYTELFAAFSPELNMQDGGSYIIPWGRKHPSPRADLVAALSSKEEGGAAFFAEWCEAQIRDFR